MQMRRGTEAAGVRKLKALTGAVEAAAEMPVAIKDKWRKLMCR